MVVKNVIMVSYRIYWKQQYYFKHYYIFLINRSISHTQAQVQNQNKNALKFHFGFIQTRNTLWKWDRNIYETSKLGTFSATKRTTDKTSLWSGFTLKHTTTSSNKHQQKRTYAQYINTNSKQFTFLALVVYHSVIPTQ